MQVTRNRQLSVYDFCAIHNCLRYNTFTWISGSHKNALVLIKIINRLNSIKQKVKNSIPQNLILPWNLVFSCWLIFNIPHGAPCNWCNSADSSASVVIVDRTGNSVYSAYYSSMLIKLKQSQAHQATQVNVRCCPLII